MFLGFEYAQHSVSLLFIILLFLFVGSKWEELKISSDERGKKQKQRAHLSKHKSQKLEGDAVAVEALH